jgi:hypothetical protein
VPLVKETAPEKPEHKLFDQPVSKPTTNAVVRPAFPTMATPMNPNVHHKNNTRF